MAASRSVIMARGVRGCECQSQAARRVTFERRRGRHGPARGRHRSLESAFDFRVSPDPVAAARCLPSKFDPRILTERRPFEGGIAGVTDPQPMGTLRPAPGLSRSEPASFQKRLPTSGTLITGGKPQPERLSREIPRCAGNTRCLAELRHRDPVGGNSEAVNRVTCLEQAENRSIGQHGEVGVGTGAGVQRLGHRPGAAVIAAELK